MENLFIHFQLCCYQHLVCSHDGYKSAIIIYVLSDTVFETSNAADDCYKILDFSTNDVKKCHNYSIANDDICEQNLKIFSVGLSIIASVGARVQQNSNLSTATIFIDDSREPECCKYLLFS